MVAILMDRVGGLSTPCAGAGVTVPGSAIVRSAPISAPGMRVCRRLDFTVVRFSVIDWLVAREVVMVIPLVLDYLKPVSRGANTIGAKEPEGRLQPPLGVLNQPPPQNFVIFGAGGFGYFLTEAGYSLTAFGAATKIGISTHPTTKAHIAWSFKIAQACASARLTIMRLAAIQPPAPTKCVTSAAGGFG